MNQLYKIQLIEKNNITRAWKAFHIFFLICAAIPGLCGGIVLSFLYNEEDYLCETPIIKKVLKYDKNRNQRIINKTAYELDFIPFKSSEDNCEYTEYALITSFIFATIWVVFFTMCGRGGKSEDGLPKPWRIVLPALVFCTIMTFINVGACIQLTVAKAKFCETFDKALTAITHEAYHVKCQKLHLFMKINEISYLRIQAVMITAEAMVWMCMVSWALSTALCILRMVRGPDFQQVLVPLTNSITTGHDHYKLLSRPSTIKQFTRVVRVPSFSSEEIPSNTAHSDKNKIIQLLL